MTESKTFQFEIEPHVGIGPVKLGMTRSEVKDALGSIPDHGLDQAFRPTMDYAFQGTLQIEYDTEGKAQFIGASYHTGCGCTYHFRGRHISEYSAEELFHLLAELDGASGHSFNRSEYHFPRLMMTVWDADEQYDRLGGESRPVFAQVAVTNARYGEAIQRLESEK